MEPGAKTGETPLRGRKKWQEETHPYLSTKPSLHIIASKRDYTDP